jgi:hypothetical protein
MQIVTATTTETEGAHCTAQSESGPSRRFGEWSAIGAPICCDAQHSSDRVAGLANDHRRTNVLVAFVWDKQLRSLLL